MNRNNTTRKSTGDDIANVNLFATTPTTSSITFTQCAPEATEFGEITQNKRPLHRSRSLKITDLGTNRNLIIRLDFLLVINNNFPPILHRFRDIAIGKFTIAVFGYPSCVYPLPLDGGVPWDDLRKIFHRCHWMTKVSNGVEILPKISTD